jgi:hypothetical protein
MAKYYGEETYFNNDVTFYKNVNIQGSVNYDFSIFRNITVREQSTLGVTTTTSLSAQSLNVSGITTLGTVKVSSGIVTATSGIATYYGDGSNLTGIVSIPTGVIVMWSGLIANIPSGWKLCDGNNGTPDLRDKFVIGASIDAIVGVNTATTTITGSSTKTGGTKDAIVVSHTHGYSDRTNEGTGGGQGGGGANTGTQTLSKTTDSTGSSGTDANLPPYLALAFIMKT